MKSTFNQCRVALWSVCALVCTVPVYAQGTAPSNVPAGFRISAVRQIIRANGLRLEGNATQPARIQSPQLDVAAQVIAFDYAGNTITQIRAQNGVNFKLNMAGADKVRIEATSNNAVLDPVLRDGKRTLTLTGNVKGFYEVGGLRNTLSGTKTTIRFGAQAAQDLSADIEGGTQGVRLEIPIAQKPGQPAGMLQGNVVVTSDRASISQADGVAHLIGNAHAVSDDGPTKFDVTAPEFQVKFSTAEGNRSLDSFNTVGRAFIKVDMPPDADAKPETTPANNAGNAGTNRIGRPTHMEVYADSAVATRSNQSIVLQGNLDGFYRLSPTADSTEPVTDQKFSGDRAVVKFVSPQDATADNPAGPNIEVSGRPAFINIPGLSLGF